MPTVVLEEIDSLNAVMVVSIPKSDYAADIKRKIRDLRKKVSMRGFRAGKTPASLIRKMHGKQLLGEAINELLEKGINDYLKESQPNMVGQPIPNEDQIDYDFDLKRAGDFEFRFDVGFAPEFELKGFSSETTVPYYKVTPTEEQIEETIKDTLQRNGDSRSTIAPIEEKDLLELALTELEEGEVKEGGITATAKVATDLIKDEAVAANVLEKSFGYTFDINIFDLDSGQDEKGVRKYILDVEEDAEFNSTFRAEIKDVLRFQPALMDEEFYKKSFPEGNVTNEEEFRVEITKVLTKSFENQGKSFFVTEAKEYLKELNPVELPEAFLKRWLKVANKEVTEAQIEKEFAWFKTDLHWTLIQNKILDQLDVEITDEDIKKSVTESIAQYFGGIQNMNDQLIDSMFERIKTDPKAWDEEVRKATQNKIGDILVENIGKEEKEINADEFKEIIDAYQKKLNALAGVEEEEENDSVEIEEEVVTETVVEVEEVEEAETTEVVEVEETTVEEAIVETEETIEEEQKETT